MTEDEKIVAQIGFEKGFAQGIEAAAKARGIWFGFNSSGEPTGEYCTVKAHDPGDMKLYISHDAIRALSPQVEAWQPTHQHVKRGTEYRHIGTARIQSDVPLDDYSEVEVYIGAEGDLWARRKVEFHDGRFRALASQKEANNDH